MWLQKWRDGAVAYFIPLLWRSNNPFHCCRWCSYIAGHRWDFKLCLIAQSCLSFRQKQINLLRYLSHQSFSFIIYKLLCHQELINSLVWGIGVKLIFSGPRKPSTVSPKLVAPVAEKLCCYLPFKIRKICWCDVRFDQVSSWDPSFHNHKPAISMTRV